MKRDLLYVSEYLRLFWCQGSVCRYRKLFCGSKDGNDSYLPLSSPFLKAENREKYSCFWETKMLSTILLRWWKSLLKRLPQEGKMKEGKKKTIEFSGCFMPLLRHHHSATTQVRPSTSQEVKPSQGIVWLGSLFNTQSLPPSLHLGKPQGREPKSKERTWFRGPPSNPTLTNWCRKGREACPLLGWVL